MGERVIRVLAIAALAVFVVAAPIAPAIAPTAASAFDKQSRAPVKPGARPGAESCRWAKDNECDEPVIGTGACGANSDYSDCRYLRYGESDACSFARDGECDEPGFGTGACAQGSDRTDCGDVSALRFRDDSCATAFDGVCNEPGLGNGTCARRSDRADCVGRARPPRIQDHFFGHDDRQLLAEDQAPWRMIGQLTLSDDQACTATLVGPDIILTAGHCILGENGVNARGEFVTARNLAGGPYRANVTAYILSRAFNLQRFESGATVDGHDWAMLRLDRRLGDTLGFLRIRPQIEQTTDLHSARLYQAGYGWDTGERLAGHLGCTISEVFADNTFAHQCDTTRGDSGSPFLMRMGDAYEVVGVDSRFRSNEGAVFLYVAVNARAFEPYLTDFSAGRLRGGRVGGARK